MTWSTEPPRPPSGSDEPWSTWTPPGGAGPVGSGAFRPLRGLSSALVWLFVATAAAHLIHVVLRIQEQGILSDIEERPWTVQLSTVEASDDRINATGGLVLLLLAATGIVFIVWLYRASKNAEWFAGRLRMGPGWAIGSWFVPFANLGLPKRVVNDAYRAAVSPPGMLDAETKVPPVFLVWWLLFVAGEVLGRIAGASADGAAESTTLDAYRDASQWSLVGSSALAASAVLAIFVVRTLTDVQHARGEHAGHRVTPTA